MNSIIVLPGIKRRSGLKNYVVVDTKDFTLEWCCQFIGGMRFTNAEIWESSDSKATAYTLARVRTYGSDFSVLLTRSVWDDLEKYYREHDVKESDIEVLKSWCDIVEDLNGSN